EAIARQTDHDVALVCSSHAGGGLLAERLPRSRPAFWWPTGWGEGDGFLDRVTRAARRWASGPHRLDLPLLSSSTDDDPEPDPLRWCSGDASRLTRRTLPLWDGEYLLAPSGLVGRAGAVVLEAFARVARERSSLDLVVLSDPDPDLERRARRLEIGTRVH